MSNIVIDESRILQLEEDRVTLRNYIRSQGIGCKDDETLESLIAKVDDIQGWRKFVDKTISGVLYDDTLTGFANSQFANLPNITGVIFTKATSQGVTVFQSDTALKFAVISATFNIGQNVGLFSGCPLVKGIFPRNTGNATTATINSVSQNLLLLDLGSIPTLDGNTPFDSRPSFKYFILRKADSITTLDNTSILSGSSPLTFVPQAQISNYESGTNWSATSCTFLALEGSRFEDLDWWEDVYNLDGTPKNTCTLDGNLIETADNETVAIFKHTENISHCYENGVELQDTDLVKGKTLTSTI